MEKLEAQRLLYAQIELAFTAVDHVRNYLSTMVDATELEENDEIRNLAEDFINKADNALSVCTNYYLEHQKKIKKLMKG